MEKHLRRYLTKEEVIHHKDENRQNNKLENLELLSRKDHASLHLGKLAKTIEITCTYCKKVVIKRYNQIVTKLKNGQKDFYCNRSCMAKHFGKSRHKNNAGVA